MAERAYRLPKRAAGGRQMELGEIASVPRRFARRWAAAGLILLASLLAILFVANAIAVNELMGSIATVETERDEMRRANDRLRGELTRMMSVEYVIDRAGQIGMIEPTAPPTVITAGE